MAKRRTYTGEFKREAVRLLTEQGYGVSEAARSLGIHPNLLRTWRNKLAHENGGSTVTPEEHEELKRLREENHRLRMERDILKKAAARHGRFVGLGGGPKRGRLAESSPEPV